MTAASGYRAGAALAQRVLLDLWVIDGEPGRPSDSR